MKCDISSFKVNFLQEIGIGVCCIYKSRAYMLEHRI